MAAKYVGAHTPTSKGIGNAIRESKRIGCTAVQVFTSSPRQWKSLPPTAEKIADIKAAVKETGIDRLISHDTYLVNLCAVDREIAKKSEDTLRDELTRCAAYGIPHVVSHIGALNGQDKEESFGRITQAILRILDDTPDSVTLLMETTAGQGSAVNSRFEELSELLERCKAHKRLAVCLDTCHVFVAGYDLRTKESYEIVMDGFDCLVGLKNLHAIHLNDSKKGLGSKIDRHENIGKGELGVEPFRFLMNDPRLENIPMVIETDVEDEGHEKDIATLRGLME